MKKPINIILALTALVYVVINYSYFSNFKGKLSDSQEIWGQYGDFIGGTLNPLFAIALIYLTYTISKSNDDRVSESIEVERIVAISQMRRDILSNLIIVMDESKIFEFQNQKIVWNTVTSHVLNFEKNNRYLFEKLYTNDFKAIYREMLKCLGDLSQFDQTKIAISENKLAKESEEHLYEFIKLLETYSTTKSTFISTINRFILDDLIVRK